MRRTAAVLAALLLTVAGATVFAQEDPPAQQPEVVSADVTYVVVERDNLDRIGALFDVRVACIRETNNLAPGHILQPGDELVISATCPAYDGADIVVNRRENAPGRDGSDGTYVVRPQDTLDQIGQRLNVSVEALKQANDIVYGRTLRAGQVIQIPDDAPAYGVVPALTRSRSRTEAAPEGATFYVVQPQQTIDGIGALLNKNHYCIIEANDITNVRLVLPGTELVIPADCGPYTGFDRVSAEAAIIIIEPETTTDDAGDEGNDGGGQG